MLSEHYFEVFRYKTGHTRTQKKYSQSKFRGGAHLLPPCLDPPLAQILSHLQILFRHFCLVMQSLWLWRVRCFSKAWELAPRKFEYPSLCKVTTQLLRQSYFLKSKKWQTFIAPKRKFFFGLFVCVQMWRWQILIFVVEFYYHHIHSSF